VAVRDERIADGLVVAALVGLVCVPVWPGIFFSDSQFMLLEARKGTITNNYAPLHGWIWSLLDRVGIPPGVVFLLGVAAFVTAVLVLAKHFLPARAARVVTFVIVLFPPVYGLLGLVGRDVWFTTSALVITVVAWHVLRQPTPPSIGTVMLLVVVGGFAADGRQNGFPFAVLAVVVATLGTLRRLHPRASVPGRIGLAAVGLGLFFPALLIAQRTVVTHRLYPEQSLYASDLIGVSLTRNEPVLDDFLFPVQDVELLRSYVGGTLDVRAVVYAYPQLVRHRNDSQQTNSAWAKQWRRMLRDHPGDYLIWRGKLYLAQMGITHDVRDAYFEGPWRFDNGLAPAVANAFPSALDARNRALSIVNGPPASGTLLVAPALYLVIAVGSIGMLARRRREWRAAGALLVVLGAMQVILFFTAPGSEFRLQYFQVVFGTAFCSIAIACLLQSSAGRKSAQRSELTSDDLHGPGIGR
jgi:hypothetical protein